MAGKYVKKIRLLTTVPIRSEMPFQATSEGSSSIVLTLFPVLVMHFGGMPVNISETHLNALAEACRATRRLRDEQLRIAPHHVRCCRCTAAAGMAGTAGWSAAGAAAGCALINLQ